MDEVEVRELRYFRAVAEELNFSRAAVRLGMAQPPLSRAIRLLERRLRVQLFQRTSRQVTLTPAGHVLLVESAKALDAVAAAVRHTRRAAEGAPALIVTTKPGIAPELLRRIVDGYAAEVEVVVSGFGEQAAMVRDGRADVALLGCPGDHDGLEVEVIFTEARIAALPPSHELAARPALTCADLAGLPTPSWARASAAERAYWAGQDVGGGPVRSGPRVEDISQLLEIVALGQAVALVPESVVARYDRTDIVYRPVLDATPHSLALAWPEGGRDARTARLVRTAIELSAVDRPAGSAFGQRVPSTS